jgi:haloalkane dehalogenase
MERTATFTEHRIPRGKGNLYARDHEGASPAFVLMHGFPDNLHIWDDLVPDLVAAGRRVVTFDFLGYGASDKPADADYSFAQQLGDLEAVVQALGLEKIVPVAHDASGPAALNYALAHPTAVAEVVMLNSAYDETRDVLWPELITLFATPGLHAMALATAQAPEQFGWLLNWQQARFRDALPDALKAHFAAAIGQLVATNFTVQPSSAPAFAQLAAQFFEALAANGGRGAELRALRVPIRLIWGQHDPYLTVAMAERRQAQFTRATLKVLPAGHWLQADMPEQVAGEMLS